MANDNEKEFSLNVTPAIFWASLIAFVGTCYVSIFSNSHHQDQITFVFNLFCFVYIFRVYLGLLMVTYDETYVKAMRVASPVQRRNYHLIFFWLLFICLMVGYFFDRYEENAGAVVVGLSSLGYFFWWCNFFKITFEVDTDHKSNAIILVMDIFCGLLVLAFFFKDRVISWLGPEPEQALGMVTGVFYTAILIVGVIFLIEIVLVHRQSLLTFWKETIRMVSKASY